MQQHQQHQQPPHQSQQTQPYQRQAVSHPAHQPASLNSPAPSQQAFGVQPAYGQSNSINSPYLNHHNQFQPQQQQHSAPENPYYTSAPSPRSSNGATYYPSDNKDHMAAAATMQRPPYPPMYHTPQSNSPASVTSPQTHDHGRPMFPQQPAGMAQQMYGYYSPLAPMQSPYSHNQPPLSSAPMLQNSYNPSQINHAQVSPHLPANTSPRIKADPNSFSGTPQQRHQFNNQQPTPGPTPGSAGPGQAAPSAAPGPTAAPGPIPATTPLVVRQDGNGVQWIAFEYSRDRVKMEYTIRCDVESVNTKDLASEFKSDNCVYPRACVPKEQYKGNRLTYESECNQVGWALAELNPCLRGKRGLIQRAVDSWRNSNQDPRLRSRRVRRQAKIGTKNRNGSSTGTPTAAPASVGLAGSGSMPAPTSRGNVSIPRSNTQVHHHHGQHEMTPVTQDPSTASSYANPQNIHRPTSAVQHVASPHEIRQAQNFPGYQPFPTTGATIGSSLAPPMPGTMHQFGRPGDSSAVMSKRQRDQDEDDSGLFGDLPEGKRRKFILVEDTQKGSRVRVKVTLDQVNVQDIPDSYRKQNSVFPRSYYPIQMQSEPEAGRFNLESTDAEDGAPTVGSMTVPCITSDGESSVEVAQLTKAKCNRERNINELGYRMAWGQGRVFSKRPIFLARSVDAFRVKQRGALASSEREIPAHLEVRPGKRRWMERVHPSTLADAGTKDVEDS